MRDQKDLFDLPPRPKYPEVPGYVKGSDTSRSAANDVNANVQGLRKLILDHIKRVGNATCDEVEAALSLRHQTASARIRELSLGGLLRDSGVRRRTRGGSSARVYNAVEEKC